MQARVDITDSESEADDVTLSKPVGPSVLKSATSEESSDDEEGSSQAQVCNKDVFFVAQEVEGESSILKTAAAQGRAPLQMVQSSRRYDR